MIEVGEIRQIASQWDIPEETIERDYVLGWLLWGFASHEELQRHLVFRGGTCLKKCYVDTHRYSEDLDFTAFGDAHLSIDEISSFVNEILKNTTSTSGIDFLVRKPKFRYSEDRQFIHGKAYFRGPRNTPPQFQQSLIFVSLNPSLDHQFFEKSVTLTGMCFLNPMKSILTG